MFDFSHLPQNAVLSEYVFNSYGITASQIWTKPPNVRFVLMLGIGGGGGGAGGVAGTAGTSRNGGGGGGSGAMITALYLAHEIPNRLIINPYSNSTNAGNGGASNSAGVAGVSVLIMNYTSNTTPVQNVRFLSVGGGAGGTTTSGGSGTGTSISDSPLSARAIFRSITPNRTGTWVANGLPSSTSIGTGLPILGGSGGGGVLAGTPTVFNGAGFTSEIPAILPDIAGGLASSGLDASSGVRLPFVSVGGAGGGANDNGTGGRGGNGVGYGAGGGGGGAGVTGQGGRGGDGGPAYACIIAW